MGDYHFHSAEEKIFQKNCDQEKIVKKRLPKHTMREENFAGINFRQFFFFRHFAEINFRALGFTTHFTGINFREWSLNEDFPGINFR